MRLPPSADSASSVALSCSPREVHTMEGFANLIQMLDYVLDTKRKRHITGGILLSAAMLFGGLAMTVMSIRDDEPEEEEDTDEQ